MKITTLYNVSKLTHEENKWVPFTVSELVFKYILVTFAMGKNSRL